MISVKRNRIRLWLYTHLFCICVYDKCARACVRVSLFFSGYFCYLIGRMLFMSWNSRARTDQTGPVIAHLSISLFSVLNRGQQSCPWFWYYLRQIALPKPRRVSLAMAQPKNDRPKLCSVRPNSVSIFINHNRRRLGSATRT